MSNEIDYFPRGSSTTKTDIKTEKPRTNRIDRDDLFLGTSTKRKRSQHDSQKTRSQKMKKSLDGEDHQNILYRRLHKQVCLQIFSRKKKSGSRNPRISMNPGIRAHRIWFRIQRFLNPTGFTGICFSPFEFSLSIKIFFLS